MFNYGWKTKTFLGVLLAFSIILVFYLVSEHDAKANDLLIVENSQKIALGMEKYYTKYNVYPEANGLDLSQIKIITENGINKNGEKIYFRENLIWDREVGLNSKANEYTIDFTLTEKWQTWNITSREGAVCNIVEGLNMLCENKPATFLDYFR